MKVVAAVVRGWVGIAGLCRLGSGSLSIGCVGFVVSGVWLCRVRLLVMGGRGWGVVVVRFLSSMRWDLRVVVAVVWRVGGGQGWVVSVFLISCIICVILWSSSPVRVYQRWICES